MRRADCACDGVAANDSGVADSARIFGNTLRTLIPARRRALQQGKPIYAELAAITAKTVGVAAQLSAALALIAAQIDVAFIFGSIARGNDHSGSDVDVMILADSLDYASVYEALQPVEKMLDRRISPMLMSKSDWNRRAAEGGSFIERVAATPLEFLIGGAGELTLAGATRDSWSPDARAAVGTRNRWIAARWARAARRFPTHQSGNRKSF